MSFIITPELKSVDGVPIGTPYGGGYVAGFISHTADGNPTHALIVAPRATGASGTGYTITTNLAWKTTLSSTAGTNSSFDGVANTAAMVTAGIANHPAANFCVGLTIGGFTDWYLPARFELDIAYFNLKPTITANNTSSGANPYSVPKRSINNTAGYPTQTPITAFNTSTEEFVANWHWSSTQATSTNAWRLDFSTGQQTYLDLSPSSLSAKFAGHRVRAFRRIAL